MIEENQLPCPRLEFRWERIAESDEPGAWNWKCTYSLVLPLQEWDIRSTDVEGNPREKFLEIGVTRSNIQNNYSPVRDGIVDAPFRDGTHIQLDNESLGGHLPMIAICGDAVTVIEKRQRQKPLPPGDVRMETPETAREKI